MRNCWGLTKYLNVVCTIKDTWMKNAINKYILVIWESRIVYEMLPSNFKMCGNVQNFSSSRINHRTHRNLEARIHEVVPSRSLFLLKLTKEFYLERPRKGGRARVWCSPIMPRPSWSPLVIFLLCCSSFVFYSAPHLSSLARLPSCAVDLSSCPIRLSSCATRQYIWTE